jgi:hypothetical protein
MWTKSGLSAKAFAEQSGLKASTLAYWRWRLQRKERSSAGLDEAHRPVRSRRAAAGVPPSFIEIEATQAAETPLFEIVLGHERRIRVPSSFDEGTLRRLVSALEAR